MITKKVLPVLKGTDFYQNNFVTHARVPAVSAIKFPTSLMASLFWHLLWGYIKQLQARCSKGENVFLLHEERKRCVRSTLDKNWAVDKTKEGTTGQGPVLLVLCFVSFKELQSRDGNFFGSP